MSRARTFASVLLVTAALVAPDAAVATPEWLPAEPVGSGAERPLAAVLTPAGAMTVAWAGQASGAPAILAVARPAGGPFTTPAPVSRGAGEVGAPSLAVAPDGTAAAAWAQKNAGGAWVVRAAVRSPAGTWSEPTSLSAPAPADQQPRAAIADNGEVLVAWHGPVISIVAVQVARRSPAGVWSPAPTDLSLKPSSETRLVMDGAGNATALWLQRESAGGGEFALGVAVATRAAGGTWTMPRLLTTAPDGVWDGASVPDLTVGPDGRVAAVWYRFVRGYAEGVIRAPGAADWTGPDVVGPRSVYPGDAPVIALDAAGTATATWSFGSGIHAARRAAGGAWSTPMTVLSANIFPDAYEAAVSAAPGGMTLVAWYSEEVRGPFHLQAATHTAAGGWSPAQELGALPARPRGVVTLTDDQGNGTVVWNDEAGSVRARTYDVGGPDLRDVSVPATATAGEPVTLSAAPRDRWSALGAITWELGDGAFASGPQVAHAFAPGTYVVRVRSADVHGNESVASRTLTVVAPPPPPPPPPRLRPTLTAGAATLTAAFSRSAPRGKPALRVTGTLSEAGTLRFTLNGPLRPKGERGAIGLGSSPVPAGAFTREPAIPASSVANLLPGAYTLTATGADGLSATWPLTLAAPPEGVVLTRRMSTSRRGPSLLAVTRAKQLWAEFQFLPGATTTRKLRARWYAPKRRTPVGSFAVAGARPFSYWRNPDGLAKGRWRCELVAGKTVVASVAIRIG